MPSRRRPKRTCIPTPRTVCVCMYVYVTLHASTVRTHSHTRVRVRACVRILRAHPACVRSSVRLFLHLTRNTRLAKCEVPPHMSPPPGFDRRRRQPSRYREERRRVARAREIDDCVSSSHDRYTYRPQITRLGTNRTIILCLVPPRCGLATS